MRHLNKIQCEIDIKKKHCTGLCEFNCCVGILNLKLIMYHWSQKNDYEC